MREILFRAKVAKHDYISPYQQASIGKWVTFTGIERLGELYVVKPIENLGAHLVYVDPETICHYTGLNDKNGKKIFDKDIVFGVKDYRMKYLHIWWDKDECLYQMSLTNGFNVKKLTRNNMVKAQVVGNTIDGLYHAPESK